MIAGTCSSSVLWRALRFVAPGQPAGVRRQIALSAAKGISADVSRARAVEHTVSSVASPSGRRLVIFGDRPLDPSLDSASHRMGWVVQLAIELGYAVSFYSSRQRAWYEVHVGQQPGATRLEQATRPLEGGVGVVWIVRPEAAAAVGSALSSLRPRLRVIYDTLDLHHVRLARERVLTGSRGLRMQVPLMRALEKQAISRADLALAITEEEAAALRRLTSGTPVAVLPNVHPPREDEPPSLAARSGLLFIGNYAHSPNVDAVEILVREVMPRLWERRPELTLSVVGRSFPDERLTDLDPRVLVHGWVLDVRELLDTSALLVAPLRFGAGLKGKIGFAIAQGLPVVTTPVGAEGFPDDAGLAVCPVGDWTAFADRTLELLDREELWSRQARRGIEITRRDFAPSVLADRLRWILEGDLGNGREA
jgi:Glycosyl transferases group 1